MGCPLGCPAPHKEGRSPQLPPQSQSLHCPRLAQGCPGTSLHHPACHSTPWEQAVPGGVMGGGLWRGDMEEGCPVTLPCTLQEVRAGQCISPGHISQHEGITAWFVQPLLHLLQPDLQLGSLWARHGDSEAMWAPGCSAHLDRSQGVPHPPPARSRQDTAGSGSSLGRGRSWPCTGHTCSPRSQGGRGRCCSRGTAG